jgi:hypothetical protein
MTFLVTGITFLSFLAILGVYKFWKLRKVIENDELQHLSSLPKLFLASIRRLLFTRISKT